jgi:predicted DCC family thiol-disulfide oxidoreductase YuxK
MDETTCDCPAKGAAVIRTDPGTATAPLALTVYYDGACPLCRVEIAHYRRQQGADAIRFVDVADPTACGPGLSHEQALARFHVRDAEGQLLSGAAAFVGLWQHLPRWRWLGRVAALPPVLALLELGYRAFLPLRPALSRRLGPWLAARATPPGR